MRFEDLAEINPSVPIRKGDIRPFIDMSALPQHARDVSELGEREFTGSGSRFQNGDTLIARITPCLENGKGALVHSLPEGVPGFGSTEFIVARARSERDMRFVYYLTRSQQFREIAISRMEGTSGRQRVSWQQIASIEIPDLRPDEREEIGDILGALDDKIELNRRMAMTLEEMARALYRSWFVNFEPVKTKAEGLAPAFMDEATAALFPDQFGDDGLPEGWSRQAIGLHFRALKGLSYKGSGLCDENAGLPLHNLNSVLEGGGYKYSGIKYYRGDYKDRHVVHPGDLIVANTEQGFDHMLIGHSAIVPRNFGPMGLFSHHLYKVEPKASTWLSREWLYLTLSAGPSGAVIRSFSNGTTVNMLPSDAFDLPLIVVAPQPVIAVFNRLTSPWFERRDEAIAQTATLGTLRDTLLPKLMSGELRVAEARDQIEEVA